MYMRHVDSKSSDLLETTFVSYSCFISFWRNEGRVKNCSVQIDQFVGGCQGNGKAKKEQKKIS